MATDRDEYNAIKRSLPLLTDADVDEIKAAVLTGKALPPLNGYGTGDRGSFTDLMYHLDRNYGQPAHVIRRMVVKAVTGDEKHYVEASRKWDETHPNQSRRHAVK